MLAEQNIIIRPLEERDLPILTRWQSPEFRGAFQECQMESEIVAKKSVDGKRILYVAVSDADDRTG